MGGLQNGPRDLDLVNAPRPLLARLSMMLIMQSSSNARSTEQLTWLRQKQYRFMSERKKALSNTTRCMHLLSRPSTTKLLYLDSSQKYRASNRNETTQR